MTEGWIWDIKKYALHDGPGIRTTVFLKGCPLHCMWCCNPESQRFSPQVVWDIDRCLHCGLCVETCPHRAVAFVEHGGRTVDPERCEVCGLCADRCPGDAVKLAGRRMTVEQVLEEISRDGWYHSRSGGGLTLSGGEPLAQPEFAYDLLREYKTTHYGLHTTVDTCGSVPWRTLERIIPYVDLFLYDVKHMDPGQHHRFTGVCNKPILENLERLADAAKDVVVRVPLIPECNDDEENIRRTAEFVQKLSGVQRLDLLPYHRLGEPKYRRLAVDYPLRDAKIQPKQVVDRLKAIVGEYGLRVRVGG